MRVRLQEMRLIRPQKPSTIPSSVTTRSLPNEYSDLGLTFYYSQSDVEALAERVGFLRRLGFFSSTVRIAPSKSARRSGLYRPR